MHGEQNGYMGSNEFFAAYMASDRQSARTDKQPEAIVQNNPDQFNGEDPAIVAITGNTPTIRREAREDAGKRVNKALATGAA